MAIFWPPPQSMPIRDSIFMQLFKTRLCVLDSAFCLEHCVLCPFFQSSRRQSTRKHFALYSNSNISAVVTLACIAQKIKHQRVGPLDGDCARLLLFKAFLGDAPLEILYSIAAKSSRLNRLASRDFLHSIPTVFICAVECRRQHTPGCCRCLRMLAFLVAICFFGWHSCIH